MATQRAASDSLDEARWAFYGTTDLTPNDSRFQGFKSAGKLGLIHDDKLLNLILDLYQERIPSLLSATHSYSTFITDKLEPYLDEHATLSDSNLPILLTTERMKRYLHRGQNTSGVLERYHQTLQESRAVILSVNQYLEKS